MIRARVDRIDEETLARLTDAVYQVALRHGLKAVFLDAELELWAAVRGAVDRELGAGSDRPAARAQGSVAAQREIEETRPWQR